MEEVPFEDRVVPRAEIDWTRSAWWWIPLTRAIHPAIKMSTLVIGLLATGLARLGVYLADRVFQPNWGGASELLTLQDGEIFSSPILTWLAACIRAVLSIEFGWTGLGFFTFLVLWMTAIFSLVGGVLARRAMVELGQQTIAPWGESIKIVFGRWVSFLWASGMHLVGLAMILLPFFLLGQLSRLGSVGANIAGVLLLLGFPLAFAVGRLCMSLVFCYPLSVCAIAAEKRGDAFEGFSRSNAYLFQRPVLALLCAACLLVVGFIGEQLVYWTLTFGWGLIRNVYFFGAGSAQSASDVYVGAGDALKAMLVASYWFSFLWSGSAALYLVLRRAVDSTELDELDAIESDIEKKLPEIPKNPPEASGSDPEVKAEDKAAASPDASES